ncbi:MAG: monofunctional biosynthetic peptidoglycan transglycosylase [Bacteroidota bacterium]
MMKTLRVFALWVKNHKVKSLFLFFTIIALVELATIPFFSILKLKAEIPERTAFMQQRIDEAEDRGKTLTIKQRWIPLSRLPKHVIDAIVVAEDGTFFSHGGFDWYEVQESIERNIKEQRAARGASTITQQLAKNLYLSTSKDPVRKLKEALITVMMEKTLTKSRILEIYLNVIEWGSGIFGIESAARTYFGKSASELTLEETVRLAAIIPAPLSHKPTDNSRYVLRRKNIVLSRMKARRIAPETAEEVQSNPHMEVPTPVPEEFIVPEEIDSTDTTEEDHGL